MRFLVRVERVSTSEWLVRVEREAAPPTLVSERRMRRLGDTHVFPQPPAAEAAAISGAEPHQALCQTADVRDILEVYRRIVSKTAQSAEVLAFGRYLFASLIGDAWDAIVAAAGVEPVELALVWAEDEWELHRLPWEMMHGPDRFLAAERRGGAITRVVAGAPAGAARVSLQPSVMFVVGVDLNDPRVRAGTEYLGLLRRLEEKGLTLNSLLLQRATLSQLKRELERFRPSVLHFICHGWFDDAGKGYLDMTPEPGDTQPARLYASSLLTMLQGLEVRPQIVVLNACYSSAPPADRKLRPMTAELVQGGVPMVVGMAGRVADMACRLFTWCFYQALLQGKSVAEAAALGRRAGITEAGADPTRFTDWALPNIYLAEGVSSCVDLDQAWSDRYRERERCARVYRALTVVKPEFFCDRHHLFECYRALLDDATTQTTLAVEADVHDHTVSGAKYGKSRLLAELAAQAVRDGHVPCLVNFAEGETPPTTPLALGRKLLEAVRFARLKLRLPAAPEYEVFKLSNHIEDPAAGVALHPDVVEELKWSEPASGRAVRAALCVDLLRLRDDARLKLGDNALKVIAFIDDVHRFDEAARELVENMIDEAGLGRAGDPVPVVFAFTGADVGRQEYRPTVKQLKTFLESGRFYVRKEYLRPFLPPHDDELLYQQFLLNQQPLPLIVRQDAKDELVRGMFEEFHTATKGVPSRLNSEGMETAIRFAKMVGLLEEAKDEDVLKRHV